jgi:hypothetical protein
MSAYYDYDDTGGPRPGIRLLTIVATAVVALCVAFLIGYLAHGGGQRDTAKAPPASTPPSTPAPVTSAPSPGGSATAQPVLARQPLARNTAGVIVGYSHDEQGAVAAAGNYTAALYVQTNRTHTRELAVLTSIATAADDATRIAGDFTSEDTALAKLLDVATLQSPGVIAYGHPLGYRIETATGTSATIDVYVAGGQGVASAPSDSGAAGETFYEVDQVQLVWQSVAGKSDWRMSNWSHLVQDNGPQLATIAAEGYLPFPIGQTGAAPGTTGGGS